MNKVYVQRPDHIFFYTVKMSADFCNFPFETVLVSEEQQADKAFKTKKGHRNFPFCETPAGDLIGESTAIASFFARQAGNTAFLGSNPFEAAQVNQYVSFANSSISPHMFKVGAHIFGMKEDKAAYDAGVKAIKEACKVLNTQLGDKAWLVGERLTLADITTFNQLILPFTFFLDGGFRKAMPNVSAWFLKMSKLPVVTRTAGYVKWLGAGMDQPAGGAAAAKGGDKGGKAKGGKGGKQAAAPAKKDAPKPKAAAAAAEEDEMDLFGDDPEADAAAAEALKKKAEEAKSKKKKAAPIAKSLIIWEVKPWGEDTDL